ncbi:Uu.00g144100.m01.CDS01 [Anthostomella pinea]|uniref:Uu.00g144100.m01.CDS01 n=1 Tax=Anthostomella pinea TaxID=933095 RepID=A0AAI8VRG4_9PEZI|nr:Uu.00g144100.m01.CDS01 [Anthostomella pinea]
MIFTTTIILSLAALAAASPITPRQEPQQPATVYGVDPSKPFYLYAYTTDYTSSYILQPFYTSVSQLGLQAVPEGGNATASPQANYTLSGSHYGTQLYAYRPGICTSMASCPTDPPALQWSNDEPVDGAPLTFHIGVDEPNFGGLGFYGAYHGGDFEAGTDNYLVGGGDTDLAGAFSVCDLAANSAVKLLTYHGANSSCVAVTVNAYQV